MKQKIFALTLMASFVLLSGCYPNGAEDTEDFDIAYSAFDEGFNFQNAGTYSMPDKIVILGNDEEVEFVPDGPAGEILDRIDANLQALGWTKIPLPTTAGDPDPDVELLPVSWTTTTISVWGGGYWCYWDPYYCGGGWYYPYPVVTSYTTGTLLMSMIDYNTQSNGKRRSVWTGAINGIFYGTYSTDRANKGINQVFAQSQYLRIN